MKKLFIVICLFSVVACKKENVEKVVGVADTTMISAPRRAFFTSKEQAFDVVKGVVKWYTPTANLICIRNITYLQSRSKTYGFISYLTDKGVSSLVIKKEYLGTRVIAMESIKCDGEWCDCKVISNIGNNGDVTIACSCSSCDMITHGMVPEP